MSVCFLRDTLDALCGLVGACSPVCVHASAHASVRMGVEFRRARYREPGKATEMTWCCVHTINNIWPFSLIKEQSGEAYIISFVIWRYNENYRGAGRCYNGRGNTAVCVSPCRTPESDSPDPWGSIEPSLRITGLDSSWRQRQSEWMEGMEWREVDFIEQLGSTIWGEETFAPVESVKYEAESLNRYTLIIPLLSEVHLFNLSSISNVFVSPTVTLILSKMGRVSGPFTMLSYWLISHQVGSEGQVEDQSGTEHCRKLVSFTLSGMRTN